MTRVTSRPRLLLAVAFGLVLLLGAESVVLAATTTKKGGPVNAVKVVTETAYQEISTEFTWTNVQGMSLSISVPSSEKGLLLITFSAWGGCFDSGPEVEAECLVRVVVDETEALPGAVTFASALDGAFGRMTETHSMQFVAGPLAAGAHTIKVQALTTQYGGSGWGGFYGRTLSVLRSKV